MAYVKYSWVDGEVITADKMNNLEDGVSEAINTAEEAAETASSTETSVTESIAAIQTVASNAETLATEASELADTLSTSVTELSYNVSVNTTNISTNADNISTNASDISALQDSIADLETEIASTSFNIEIVDELPTEGEENTFYLISNGDGYDKYWWITDADGNGLWDSIGSGSGSAEIVTALPDEGDEDVDYYLLSDGVYVHYRYIDGAYYIVGSNSYSKDEIDEKIEEISSALEEKATAEIVDELPGTGDEYTDYYILSSEATDDSLAVYLHYKYIDSAWVQVGSDSYTKDEVDDLISSAKSSLNSAIEAVSTELESMGNMVEDIVQGDGEFTVYFADGTTKTISVGDDSVVVEDVTKSDSGITVTYTDGTSIEIEISGGGGSSTSGSASITRITSASIQTVYGSSCPIEFTFSATDSSGDTVGDGTATWYVNSVQKTTSTVSQGDNSFDIGDYLSVGSNTVKLSVSVDTGGDSNTVVTKTWTVTAINMYIIWDYDDTTINSGDTFTLRWTPYGDVEKTTHIIIDDVEAATSTTTRNGVQQTVTLDSLDHGSHMVEMYCTATVSSTEIQSESIYHDMIFVDSGDTTPVISVSLSTYEITQYNTLQIPVVIYKYGSSTVDATLAVDGETVAEWESIDRTIHYWNYTPSESGTKVLTITCEETVKTITLTVDALDIDNEEISGYAFKLKASDLASNEALEAWSSNGYSATFSDNFDWINGGIQTETDDDDNIRQFICIKAGTTMTVDYELFGGDDDIKNVGRTFKIIFKVVNSRDYDATFLDCTYNGIGLVMQANVATVSSLQNSVETQYAEDNYIEFEYDIRKQSVQPYIQTYIDGVLSGVVLYASTDDFNQTTAQTITVGSDDCDVYIYMMKVYETYLTMDNHIENFIADAPNAVEMVSRYNRNDVLNSSGEISYSKLAEQCPDLRIHLWEIPRMTTGKKDYVDGCSYRQLYHSDDSSYTRHQLSAENVTISIQGTSSVNYRKSAANIDGNFKKCDSFTDGNGNDLLSAGGYAMEDDSMPVLYFNTKVNVASCENINNMCLAEWYNTYQPYQTIYAESIEEEGNYTPRDTMELHMGVQFISDLNEGDSDEILFDYDGDYHMYAICNVGNSKKNIEVFHDVTNLSECCVEVLDNNSNYCMMTDTSFDLDTLQSEDYFEFRFSADDADDELYTEDELSTAKSAQEQAFIDFVLWFAEGNPAAATDEDLDEEVTFGSYTFTGCGRGEDVLAGLTISTYAGTYTTDSYEYRMAKMLSECEDHLIMDSVVYHYVFVEEHTMVDNVCKNTFWSTEDLQHWQLTKNYDNDTADGINNTGELVIPYGCEGMDTLDDGDVFNGNDSVWWVFIEGLYDARQLMWQNRETAGAWDKDSYLDFVSEVQDLVPERVWNQDYWYKYLRLYEESSVSTYFDMLECGKKTHQRQSFVTNNMYYMASQYMGTTCTSQSITLRGYTPSSWSGVEPESKVEVALYTKGYIVVQVGSVYKQQKADKGTYYTVEFTDSGDMNDTVINIHGANLVQAIGDISCLYVGRSDFSAATRLRSLTMGSTEDGYSNSNLTSVSFGSNTMLEELYIQNCPNVTTTLDLSGCQALTTLDIRGSGFTGVVFAENGLVATALLCAVKSLIMKSLANLYDDYFSLESYDNLIGLIFEDCPNIDSLTFVQLLTALERLRMTGIDWTISSTDLLNELLELAGYDESDSNITQSVLAGEVTITGDVRQQELDSYEEAWEDLTVNYSANNLVTTYLATYVNTDGTVLYTCYVDQEDYPPDPVELGYIDTPTMDSDAQYDYTYSGWDNITDPMRAARTITAVYSTTTKTYTVNWYALEGDTAALETQTDVEYGADVAYSGDRPTRSVSSGTYSLFAGWDKSTGYITGDIDVYAVWERASIPESGAKDLSEMTVAEIYAIAEAGEADNYFEDKDYFDVTLGHDFDFSNVEAEELISEATFFDGATVIDTEIYPFSEDFPSFTMAIDYEFMIPDESSATLVSCGFIEDGSEGFRLRYSGTSASGYANLQWGDKSANIGYGCNRNIAVLRHTEGSTSLYVYCFNSSNTVYDDSITIYELVRTKDTESDEPITFGAVKVTSEDAYSYYGKGWIYWAKIWYDDLGDTNAQALASWPHETMRYEFAGSDRYYLADSSVYKANTSFYPNNTLSLLHCMNTSNTNEGGWDSSLMRTFVNDRYYNALPYDLQSALKQVKVKASEGSQSTTILNSSDYIFLPSNVEMGSGSTTEPYASEGSAISYYSSNANRIKVPGMIRYDTETVITNASEPTTLTAYKGLLNDGDIWINTNNSSYGYYYISADTLQYHDRFGRLDVSSSSNIEANDGGLWLYAGNYWERSAYVSNSTYFMFVYYNGNPSYNTGASSTNGVLCGFAI